MTALLTLARWKVSLLAAVSGAAGYLFAGGPLDAALPALLGGTLLLAAGASALNQWQERETDARMDRTRRRPLPSIRLTPGTVLALAAGAIAAGEIWLAGGCGVFPAALGLSAILWYNGVYTPLKRRTAFAAIPGALVGTIPPAMGWVAAGGNPLAWPLLAFMGFMFLWQVPHFWLVALLYPADAARAGLPDINRHFRPRQLGRLVFVWTMASISAAMLLPLAGLAMRPWTYVILAGFALTLGGTTAWGLVGHPPAEGFIRKSFGWINAFALFCLLVPAIDRGWLLLASHF